MPHDNEDAWFYRPTELEHRLFILGFSLHVLSGTLATIATFLDFNWQSPAAPGFGDPEEPITAVSGALTGFLLFYLGANFPATLAWSTAAGWSLNFGFIWLLAAMGFYDQLREKRVRIMASMLQSFFGVVAVGLVIEVGRKAGFHPVWGAQSNWTGSVGLLVTSVVLTLSAALLAWLSPVHEKRPGTHISGWTRPASEDNDESDRNLGVRKNRVAPNLCGDLGCCGVCNAICTIILFILWWVLIGLAIDFKSREPYTSCYAYLPRSPAQLVVDETFIGSNYGIGPFTLGVGEGNKLTVNRGSTSVFGSISGEAFVRVGYGPFSADNSYEMGTYDIRDKNRDLSTSQTITSISSDGTSIRIEGTIAGYKDTNVQSNYSLTLTVAPGTNHLAFDLNVNDDDLRLAYGNSTEEVTRLYWIHDSSADEKFFGFGQSFTYWNFKGTCMPIITREQGIGRGLQPFTYVINKAAHGSAGSWQTSYSAIPHYITNKVRSFFLEESRFIVFDMTRPERVSVELVSNRMRGRFLAETTFLDTIEQYTLFSGRMRELPDWVGKGAIIGLQGGTDTVKHQVDLLLENGVPLTGVWMQDWTGRRETLLGDRLLWNWLLNEKQYPGWHDMVAQFRSRNISVLTYINPYLANAAPDENLVRVEQPMFAEARDLGCLIRNNDGSVLIQVSATSDFTFATVDLTNPACQDWYVGIIRTNLLNVTAATDGQAFGALGWMADFGESIPFDARLYGGRGDEIHNKFPAIWAETCRKAITISNGGIDFAKETVFFTRSSSMLSPQHTTLMWLGDQMQAFNRFDGLESVIPGALSQGLSGFALSHSDIGGYLGFNQLGGIIRVVRDEELLVRWMELSAFLEPVFRSHEGVVPRVSPQITSKNSTMRYFARFATIFKALHPYRRLLMQDAESKGWPLARHPLLHFQDDRNLDTITRQAMLGDELMLCAVTLPQSSSTDCYLPAGSGTWTNFFDPTITHDAGSGLWFKCEAPLGKPCAVVRQGATHVVAARSALVAQNFEF